MDEYLAIAIIQRGDAAMVGIATRLGTSEKGFLFQVSAMSLGVATTIMLSFHSNTSISISIYAWLVYSDHGELTFYF